MKHYLKMSVRTWTYYIIILIEIENRPLDREQCIFIVLPVEKLYYETKWFGYVFNKG